MINHVLTFLRLLKWKGHIWLPEYLRQGLNSKNRTFSEEKNVHVIFLIVDHFEPSRREGKKGIEKVRDWCDIYEKIAISHCDSDGVYPQHTWFYRYDYPNQECVKILSEYVYKGFGEIEFHLHHGYDTPQTFAQKIREGVGWFNQVGAMISTETTPVKKFGYIAGNWALDNGRRDSSMSGVNTELAILNKAGCYADFTFPAFGENSQPKKVNAIYYATETSSPKSYNTGIDVKVGGIPRGDLMIFQGPLCIDWKKGYVEFASFESFSSYFPDRIDYWLLPGIHVVDRPEWIFIKLHTHGMQSSKTFLSKQLDDMFTHLEERFKKPPFELHYVNAREAYNIVKAAEAGKQGNPDAYRNFEIQTPANKKIYCNQPYLLKKYSNQKILIEINSQTRNTTLKFKDLYLNIDIDGDVSMVEVFFEDNIFQGINVQGEGLCEIDYKETKNGFHNLLSKKFSMPFSFV